MTYHQHYFRRENLTLTYLSNTFSCILQALVDKEIICVVKTSIVVY
jgi:hypothetical protein